MSPSFQAFQCVIKTTHWNTLQGNELQTTSCVFALVGNCQRADSGIINAGREQSSHKELYSKVSEGTSGKEQLIRPTNMMNERWRVDRECCLKATASLGMKRECCLEATTNSLELEWGSVATRQQLNPQKRENVKCSQSELMPWSNTCVQTNC